LTSRAETENGPISRESQSGVSTVRDLLRQILYLSVNN